MTDDCRECNRPLIEITRQDGAADMPQDAPQVSMAAISRALEIVSVIAPSALILRNVTAT